MTKEEILNAIIEIPKLEKLSPISVYNSVNVEDILKAVDRFKKIPSYNELLKENEQLKATLNEIKKFAKLHFELANESVPKYVIKDILKIIDELEEMEKDGFMDKKSK